MRTDRDRNTLIIGHRLRVHMKFPAKISINQSNRRVRAYGARVAGLLLRLYKAGLVVSKSFGLGIARVRLR